MDETLPTCVQRLDAYQTLWKIKGGENIVVGYISNQQHQKSLDRLFHQEYRTYRNNVSEHCRRASGIARMASSADHMIAGILYDTYMKSEGIIVLRDIAVLRAWQRQRVGSALLSALLEDIIRYQWNDPFRSHFDIFMRVDNDDFERQGFLKANGFEPSHDEREQCMCDVGQCLRKRSVAVPCTL